MCCGIGPYMVHLCIIKCQVLSINVIQKLWVFIEYVIDLVVYANMFILKSLIIMVGQFVGIFVMFSRMENEKSYLHLWRFVNFNYV